MEENEVIDLKDIKKIVQEHYRKLIAIVVAITAVAIAIAFILPKQYESFFVFRAKGQKQGAYAVACKNG